MAASPLAAVLRLFLEGRRGKLALGAALAALTGLAGIALLGLSGWFITATGLAGLSAAAALAFDVFRPSAGIRGLALARTASRYAERLATHEATLSLLAALRERLFRGWAQPGAARALLARPARLLFRLTADVDALDTLYLRLLVPFGAALAASAFAGLALGLVHPALGLGLAGLMLGMAVGLPFWAARRGRRAAERSALALEALRARVIDLVAGQTELVLAGRLPAQQARVMAAEARQAEAEAALNRAEAGAGFALGAAGSLALAGTLAGVAWLVGEGRIGAPVAAFALLVALAAFEPLGALRRGALEFGRTRLAARRLAPRLAPAAPAAPLPCPPPGFALVVEGLSAGHGAGPVLHDVSFALRAGERLALIGPSGAGKSTLLAALAGEIAPLAGRVASLPQARLGQATHLFRESLAENLRLAAPGADQARLWQALEEAGLAETCRAMPGGLQARLGEGGLGLSGGQRRRLALARLLLREAPLWLLDEPSEGLDGALAREVLTKIKASAGEKTIFIITHIRREAELADRLLVLDQGRIIAAHRRGEPGFAAALAALRPD